MFKDKRMAAGLLIVIALVGGGGLAFLMKTTVSSKPPAGTGAVPLEDMTAQEPASAAPSSGTVFGASATYQPATISIDPRVSADFDLATVKNLPDMERAYGFTFTDAEKKALAARKFVVKNILDTSLRPNATGDNVREFVQLYDRAKGERDFRARGQENSLFFSSDVFFHSYGNLYVELLKEMENKTFYPAMTSLSGAFFKDAAGKASAATTDADKKMWMKVRNYFAVPYAIFSTAERPLTNDDYYKDGTMVDPEKVMADYKERDAKVDTYDAAAAFLKKLGLDKLSETAALADLKTVYAAEDRAVPAIFADEYAAYAAQENVDFKVDFSQFTPRGTYTSSSLRREYFRGMKWYIMLPFFLKSADLTKYAFGVTQLMAEDPAALKDYDRLEAAIGFLVGTSDDLMPADYLKALDAAKGTPDASAAMAYLAKAHDPQIKDLAAQYPEVGVAQSADVLLKTKGMRFFSGKFIIDSYWTGYLTQGDEAPRPGYSQKLPPMASALEVMTLLGSEYAETQIPKLDFYAPENAKAIAQALAELKAKNAELSDADWQRNLYLGWLWTIKGLFDWQKTNKDALPRFMQSSSWEAKTLQTAAAFWTELRHATILYAKQSFAELGGGGPGCDERPVPPPAKAYIEPQLEAYGRLRFLAERTDKGLKDLGYDLTNMQRLERFISLLDTVQDYARKELADATLSEQVTTTEIDDPQDPEKTCKMSSVVGTSDWETLRIAIVDGLQGSIPSPVEGPVLPAKDRRTALVADVHTGGDSAHPTSILYEGTGVPYVMFAAVSDANGPRLTVGFISSQHEFVKPYGGKRMTDEEWQKNFYVGEDPYDAFRYADKASWPKPNAWYAPLFEPAR